MKDKEPKITLGSGHVGEMIGKSGLRQFVNNDTSLVLNADGIFAVTRDRGAERVCVAVRAELANQMNVMFSHLGFGEEVENEVVDRSINRISEAVDVFLTVGERGNLVGKLGELSAGFCEDYYGAVGKFHCEALSVGRKMIRLEKMVVKK